jgi:NAD+ diphosphatase
MCGFYAEALSRDCAPSDEMQELRWLTPDEIDAAVAADDVRLPPPVSIAYRLIADWYQQACGRDLEPLVRAAGNWRRRDG